MNGLSAPIETSASELTSNIRTAGIAGAGGAGFPTYPKWERIDEINHLLVNHQESEPNYYIDKWIGKEYADELSALFDALLTNVLDTVVITAKYKDREPWLQRLETKTNGTTVLPEDLPLTPDEHSGIVFAYTDDKYQYGMESVLLDAVADTRIGKQLPMDHGWIVQNTETVYNIFRAITAEEPVTRKYVHVDGNVADHRLLDVPLGTPISDLLEAAGRSDGQVEDSEVVLDGGPGWCFRAESAQTSFSVTKRTNCILLCEEQTVDAHTLGKDRVQLLDDRDWTAGPLETEPSARLNPSSVRVPLMTNPSFEGVVSASEPTVEVGEHVTAGDVIASPADGVSIPEHASISGTVTAVESTYIEIESGDSDGSAETH